MTILPHTVWKFLQHEVIGVARPSELIDSAACKAMQMHAEEIEVARRFWACPFQSLYIGGRERQFYSADANVAGPAQR